MRKQGAVSVSIITLLDKVARRVVDLTPDYRGFEVRPACYARGAPTMHFILTACKWSTANRGAPHRHHPRCLLAWLNLHGSGQAPVSDW